MCKGACKKYGAKRPQTGGRYQSGQVRCQICDIWMDGRGARTKGGSPARRADTAWYCSCCNYRLRRVPRNAIYKKRAARPGTDLSYFNKHRARMLSNLGRAIAETGGDEGRMDRRLPARMRIADVEYEFGASAEEILGMARSGSPNKISLIAELEEARHRLGRVPSKEEIGPRFSAAQYEAEFGSWEKMLDRLGYDPWYRKKKSPKESRQDRPGRRRRAPCTDYRGIVAEGLRGEPALAGLLDKVDEQLGTMDKGAVQRAARRVRLEGVGAGQQVLFEGQP